MVARYVCSPSVNLSPYLIVLSRSQNMSNFVQTNHSMRPQVTINVETHEMVDINAAKQDPEWPDMVSSDSAKSMGHMGHQDAKYAV